jgi:hypothetical protein
MYEAIIYTPGRAPITSGRLVLRGQNDAKLWCRDNAEYEDDVWVTLKDGKVIERGIIDGMEEG